MCSFSKILSCFGDIYHGDLQLTKLFALSWNNFLPYEVVDDYATDFVEYILLTLLHTYMLY